VARGHVTHPAPQKDNQGGVAILEMFCFRSSRKEADMRPIPHSRLTTLGDYRKYPGCRMQLTCTGCGWSKAYDVERVIARLGALGRGGFGTPVEHAAREVRHACPGCRRKRWTTGLAYPDDLTEREMKRMAGRYRN
jgi:hypothetical protein